MCMSPANPSYDVLPLTTSSVQVNLAAESGEMGILAQHVPSIEQLKPGLVEVIEEAGGSKQFFRKRGYTRCYRYATDDA
jgi:F0F1-type ATP synthase epsilon subunit